MLYQEDSNPYAQDGIEEETDGVEEVPDANAEDLEEAEE